MIDIEIEDAAWTTALPEAEAVALRAARAALGEDGGGVAILLTDDATVADLNIRFRDKPGPTNVLSFPAPAGTRGGRAHRVLGDIVLCAPIVAREARQQDKRLDHHWAHLVVHGVLHLLGHDHEQELEAERMERRERRVLAEFGIPDPYRISSSVSES